MFRRLCAQSYLLYRRLSGGSQQRHSWKQRVHWKFHHRIFCMLVPATHQQSDIVLGLQGKQEWRFVLNLKQCNVNAEVMWWFYSCVRWFMPFTNEIHTRYRTSFVCLGIGVSWLLLQPLQSAKSSLRTLPIEHLLKDCSWHWDQRCKPQSLSE